MLEQFRQAIERAGLTPPDHILADGELHRFASNGDPDDDAGWYILHPEGIPAGAFGCWRTGIRQTWSDRSDAAMSSDERAALQRRIAEMQRRRESAEQERHELARIHAQSLWNHATPARTDHPYLERKGVRPYGLRVTDHQRLIVPVQIDNTIVSLQFIDSEGTKRFLPRGQIQGGSYLLGEIKDTVIITEGFATAASIHEAIRLPVIVAFSAGNLEVVAQTIRAQLPDARIVIAGDCDESGVGQRKAGEAAAAVGGITVIPSYQGDWNDVFLIEGPEAVHRAFESVSHTAVEESAATERPELDADEGDLAVITARAVSLMASLNVPPTLFIHGNLLVRLEADDEGTRRPVELTVDRVRHHLAAMIRWTKAAPRSSSARTDARPPIDVAKNILASPALSFPVLKAITEVPVVVREGRLIQSPGFDTESGILYQPFDANLQIDIPAVPSETQLAQAKALLDEMIADFAFVGDPDRAHAVALAVGMFCRDLIDGPTPLHDFEAPSPGTGKNLLVESLLYPAVGYDVGVVAEAKDDDEWRKRLTARLREARPVLVIDNLSGPLDSGVIASALTSRRWEDRLLGKSETVSLPVRTLWALTANNPVLSMEIARRCVRIRLDTRTDRPWLRDGFRHANLRQWVEENRGELIRAILILVQAWLNAGRPAPPAKPLGSFESWSHVVGGIVTFAGYRGFLGNILELYETADTEGRAWRNFVGEWWSHHQLQAVSVGDLVTIAEKVDGIYLGKTDSERGKKTSLGRQLKKRRDQILVGYRIEEAGVFGGSTHWCLHPVAPELQVPTSVVEEEVNLR